MEFILRELHLPLVRPFETSFGVTTQPQNPAGRSPVRGADRLGRVHGGRASVFLRRIDRHGLAGDCEGAGADAGGGARRSMAATARGFSARCAAIRMAKAALENAIWDLEAQREGVSLSQLIGGVRETIPCGVSLGIQTSIPELMEIIEKELAAGYQRIKLKCKPGWDVEVFEKVRHRWPEITLSCDANSAYRLRDADHLVTFDAVRSADDRAAAVARRFLLPLDAAEAAEHADLPGRIDPQPARCAGGDRDGVVQDHQHQAGARGRILRGDRGAQRGAGARDSGVVRRDAGVGHWARAQHCAVDAGELFAAGRCVGVGAVLGRGHHRAGGHGVGARARL